MKNLTALRPLLPSVMRVYEVHGAWYRYFVKVSCDGYVKGYRCRTLDKVRKMADVAAFLTSEKAARP